MSRFHRYIGVDYSGAETPSSSLKGLRVYASRGTEKPAEVLPRSAGQRKYWSRRALAEWLVEELTGSDATIVGIDHAFSFPLRYFDVYQIRPNWDVFLDDFQQHWPTDRDDTYVEFIRDGLLGHGAARTGSARWRRVVDVLARAKSVFHFDVPGSVAKSTHAGLPWLRFMRHELGRKVHFWPFDGWTLTPSHSVILEVYPALWSGQFEREHRSADQHDAFSVAAWLMQADRSGALERWLTPLLSSVALEAAQAEGWILGIGHIEPDINALA